MKILLHTIAIEPARWTPQKVSRSLVDLLPRIARAHFRELEIFEPHLTADTTSAELGDAFEASGLKPVILSSYLDLNPAKSSDQEVTTGIEQIAARAEFYGFEKLRLFPGLRMSPTDTAGIDIFKVRLQQLVRHVSPLQVLLETHDGSLADDPNRVAAIVRESGLENLALLFQPTHFLERAGILEQFRIQKPFIAHVHLQNRRQDLSFSRMHEGVVPWPEILRELPPSVDATIEFVPRGICAPECFDLASTLEEAEAEAEYVRSVVTKI